jgi:hypothetical protein
MKAIRIDDCTIVDEEYSIMYKVIPTKQEDESVIDELWSISMITGYMLSLGTENIEEYLQKVLNRPLTQE